METGIIHIIIEWNSIHCFGSGLKVLLSSAMKSSTYVNYAVDETQIQLFDS